MSEDERLSSSNCNNKCCFLIAKNMAAITEKLREKNVCCFSELRNAQNTLLERQNQVGFLVYSLVPIPVPPTHNFTTKSMTET